MSIKLEFPIVTPQDGVIELLFHYTVLLEYQLIHLQSDVREFVERMMNAIGDLDSQVTDECKQAVNLYEDIYNEINKISLTSSLDQTTLIEGAVAVGSSGIDKSQKFLASLSKRTEFLARIDERVKNHVNTLIECLSFEDIQNQRLEHVLKAFKLLNEGVSELIAQDLNLYTIDEVNSFAEDLKSRTRAMYTMKDERDVFDQVFVGDFLARQARKKSAS